MKTFNVKGFDVKKVAETTVKNSGEIAHLGATVVADVIAVSTSKLCKLINSESEVTKQSIEESTTLRKKAILDKMRSNRELFKESYNKAKAETQSKFTNPKTV